MAGEAGGSRSRCAVVGSLSDHLFERCPPRWCVAPAPCSHRKGDVGQQRSPARLQAAERALLTYRALKLIQSRSDASPTDISLR